MLDNLRNDSYSNTILKNLNRYQNQCLNNEFSVMKTYYLIHINACLFTSNDKYMSAMFSINLVVIFGYVIV